MDFENRKYAIKLLFDWNKWLITIETAAIGVLGFMLRKDNLEPVVIFFGSSAVLFFVFSIVLSLFFLLNLPYLIDQGAAKNQEFLSHKRVQFKWVLQSKYSNPWKVGRFTTYINRFFIFGTMCFSISLTIGFITA